MSNLLVNSITKVGINIILVMINKFKSKVTKSNIEEVNDFSDTKNVWDTLEYASASRSDKRDLQSKFKELNKSIRRHKALRRHHILATLISVIGVLCLAMFFFLPIKCEDKAAYIKFNMSDLNSMADKASVSITVGEQRTNILKSDKVQLVNHNNEIILITEADSTVLLGSSQTDIVRIFVPKGHNLTLTLTDNSTININSGTYLECPLSYAAENAKLKLTYGEVMLSTAEGLSADVKVTTHGELKISGVSVIRSLDKQDAVLTVIQGEASLINNNMSSPPFSSGAQLVFNTEGGTMRKISNTDNVCSWVNKEFSFDNAPLSYVADELARAYGIGIVVDEHVANESVTAHFSYEEGLQQFVKKLYKKNNINCIIINGSLVIGGF